MTCRRGATPECRVSAAVTGSRIVFEDGVSMIRSMLKANFEPQWLYQTTAPSLGEQYARR